MSHPYFYMRQQLKWFERPTYNRKIVGSNPTCRTRLAQKEMELMPAPSPNKELLSDYETCSDLQSQQYPGH